MPPVAVQLSYRLGGADGVAVEARKWEWALHELGFSRASGRGRARRRAPTRRRVAPVPRDRPGRRHAARRPTSSRRRIAGADLVVVENLCSLPINPDASTMRRRPCSPSTTGAVVFHHHDLPWQRAGLADAAPASRRTGRTRCTSRSTTTRACSSQNRGFDAVTLRNAFDLDPPRGDRDAHARRVRVRARRPRAAPADRAIPRKNIPAAIAFATELGAARARRTSPPLDHRSGGGRLRRRVRAARRRVATSRSPSGAPERAADAYAAADLVVFPSTWEGFGNPVIESIAHRRPIAVGNYPVLDEMRGFGVQLLSIDDADEVQAWLRAPDPDGARAQRGAGAAALLARRPAPSGIERRVRVAQDGRTW